MTREPTPTGIDRREPTEPTSVGVVDIADLALYNAELYKEKREQARQSKDVPGFQNAANKIREMTENSCSSK